LEFNFEQCKEVKPDVINEKCPADMCGENQLCKMIEINGKFYPKCICMEGFEFDAETRMCVDKDTGRCQKNTECDIDNGEKCDKTGTGRCICRDGFMRGPNGKCVASCGKYQTFDIFVPPGGYDDLSDIAEKPDKEDYADKIPDYLRKYMKPRICDPNATCREKEVYGMVVEACVCNEGYTGDGCRCDNKETCDDLCQKKMPGSECVKNPNGDEFRCRCPKGTEHLEYKDGTPCCVAPPECKTSEDCEQMGSAWCMLNDVEGTGACQCKDPLRMNKKKMCVGKDDYDEDDYEDEEDDDDDVITDPCAGVRCMRNAHCEVDRSGQPKCVCDDGYSGKEGTNCILIVDDVKCKYGTCYGDGNNGLIARPDFPVKVGDTCGNPKMNLVCMADGCCGCARHYMDTNDNRKDGCENRKSPCDGDTLCSKYADCIDLESIKNEYEYEDKPKPYRMIPAPDDMEKPIELPYLGYKCKCREPLVGNGIGEQGCTKPEEFQINECMSLINPCGRNSDCTDKKVGYSCKCHEGYKSKTKDGKNCVKPTVVVPPTDSDRCEGFCKYTKLTKGECHLRDLSSIHTKITDYMVMDGDATENMLPGVLMKVATKKLGWPLNRTPYTAFLEFDQDKCGNVLLGAMMSGDVKVAIFDRAGADGRSVYRVDGVQGYLTKTASNSRSWSGLVVQFSKKDKTLAALTGNADDFEENQFMKELKDGTFQVKPDYDVFHLMLTGKEVSKQAMGEKFKECFNVREGAPFDFILWDERSEDQVTDTVADREKLVTLNEDFTQCYLHNKIKGKNIKDIVCKEPLVINGEKQKDNPTFAEMVASGDKDSMACTEEK
jgi:hypothetical protein